jgi:trimeric autotransporter adhesin
VRDAGRRGTGSVVTGCGTFEAVGVGVSIGNGDRVYANDVRDSAPAPGTWYGVQIGSRTARTTVSNTVTSDNSGNGVIAGVYRYAANGTPESPVAENASRASGGATLTWRESSALAGVPVGGYRVYRGGTLVADLPVGSASVPGNLLPAEASSLETGLGGWTAAGRATVARSTASAAVGSASLGITATASGTVGATGPSVSVTAGKSFTAVASYRAAGNRVRTGIVWLDASGTALSQRLFTSNSNTVATADGWITSSFTATAPTGAVAARVLSTADGVSAGETVLMDRIGLVQGSATQSFTDASAPSGAVTYQVVAYRSGAVSGSELSTPTAVFLP